MLATTAPSHASFVLIFVMHVEKNAANMLATWNTVDYVLKLVQHVHLTAEK
jgi:hypothetical protein